MDHWAAPACFPSAPPASHGASSARVSAKNGRLCRRAASSAYTTTAQAKSHTPAITQATRYAVGYPRSHQYCQRQQKHRDGTHSQQQRQPRPLAFAGVFFPGSTPGCQLEAITTAWPPSAIHAADALLYASSPSKEIQFTVQHSFKRDKKMPAPRQASGIRIRELSDEPARSRREPPTASAAPATRQGSSCA